MTIQIPDSLITDKLHDLSLEYSVSADQLVNLAVKKFIEDVELVRNLRIGDVKLE